MHLYVHSSIIYASQDTEATYMSVNRWMDKVDVVHIHNEMLQNLKKERNSAACSTMGGARYHNTKWGKSERERQIQYDLMYMQNLKGDSDEPI